MKKLINEATDRSGYSYKLFLEVSRSNLDNHFDIRFFSTYSGSSNPENEQTKWMTTLPKESFVELVKCLTDFVLRDDR